MKIVHKSVKQSVKQIHYPDLTIEDVKACKEYESISDSLAQKIVDAIKTYTEIIYNGFKEGRFEEQKAKVISIGSQEIKKAA